MTGITKKLLTGFCCIFLAATVFSSHAWAVSLSFSPSASTVDVGSPFILDVVISNLLNADLGAFDIDVSYDPSILSFDAYALTDNLGEIALGDADDWSFGDLGGGTVNIAELSLLWDLSFQADSFTLASLSFTSVGQGSSGLSFSNAILGDYWGDSIPATLNVGNIEVMNSANSTPVPEPATIFVLGTGLVGLAGVRKKFKKQSTTFHWTKGRVVNPS